jgi:hypothetical protein
MRNLLTRAKYLFAVSVRAFSSFVAMLCYQPLITLSASRKTLIPAILPLKVLLFFSLLAIPFIRLVNIAFSMQLLLCQK